ncbi:MAG TPA: 5-amino-6-(D-ribitylamino)uracil--L-tyrosine 4-hydroxyphenyl transferase CofH [Candidatus Dormibacteraeota bacterium]|nr:5-amino-6-(D-ribitylamino)uracil--L-tyrosine 4-hydroxyphenyl transferase CofH [Candidatus Dormibacteraeota bacterium]
MTRSVDPEIAAILQRSLNGHDPSVEDAVKLFDCTGLEMNMLVLVADELRRRTVGDVVTYVVNRNINFTNVCIKRCGFCAFSRGHREEEGYYLPIEEVVRRAKEAYELGATEVCIQAGLPPKMEGDLYIKICRAIKQEVPEIHIHGFSPEEVIYGAARSKTSIRDYLKRLKEAGVGSLPGTSAEILDDEVRDKISPGRISTKQWVEVITTAHELGIPTTSTIMYGHIETSLHKAKHLALLREIQKQTHGITEFVPLSFMYWEAPMHKKNLVKGVRKGASSNEVVKMYAVSRLMLNNHIQNIQVSWVKESPKFSQYCLNAGANDFGGTLINESISTAAGASHGQLMRPSEFRNMIREIGRTPAERTTTYRILKKFDAGREENHPLDMADYNEKKFGSYKNLIKLDLYRFKSFNNDISSTAPNQT